MEKFIKNPLYTGIAIMLILVLVASVVYDKYANNNKILFGFVNQKGIAA